MQLPEEYRTSLVRGVAVAVIAAVTGLLTTYSQTEELKPLIVAGVVPVLTTISGFLSFGHLDAKRNAGQPVLPRLSLPARH